MTMVVVMIMVLMTSGGDSMGVVVVIRGKT